LLFGFWLLRLHLSRDAFRKDASHWGGILNFVDFRCPGVPWPFPYKLERPNMAQRPIRFSDTTDKRIREATEKRGFSSPTAFIRHAVEQELSGHKEELVSAEERLAAGIEQDRQAVLVLGRAQQALFALVDSLGKILLTCIPEPDAARAPDLRYRVQDHRALCPHERRAKAPVFGRHRPDPRSALLPAVRGTPRLPGRLVAANVAEPRFFVSSWAAWGIELKLPLLTVIGRVCLVFRSRLSLSGWFIGTDTKTNS
jgi:hypothetical protein